MVLILKTNDLLRSIEYRLGTQNRADSFLQRDEIKAYAATLIPQISQVLESVPRPMVLILKTNDLLRSIEYRLGTQNRADSFLQVISQIFVFFFSFLGQFEETQFEYAHVKQTFLRADVQLCRHAVFDI
ncbi:unnamed protein product [Toxocara canis]|uniref:DHC_N1 domain-containing protein n=1 Tax=Toxocara canis TaxID=6265 RepID=A0A183VHL0_TOXCA|nr:unnamed protein product [Toxocara canis]